MRRLRYLLAPVIATVIYVIAAYFCKAPLTNNVLFISVLWLISLSIRFGSDILKGELLALKGELRRKQDRQRKFLDKLETIKRERIYLERKLKSLSELYAITKDMSFSVRFNELTKVLKNFLEDRFKIGKFTIILPETKEGKKPSWKTYEIQGSSKVSGNLTDEMRELMVSAAESKKPTSCDKGKVLAVPLIIRRKVIAVALAEGIIPDEHDKFLILASQIAFQIERISLFENVEKLSIMDGLTGTFRRRYFLERFAEEISRAKECGMALSFIMADLDYFKKCNDNLGHLVGDAVLKEVAALLKKNVREIDFVARFGGEEFCILLPETGKEGARAVAERARSALEGHTIKAYDESVRITISMGISSFPEDADKEKALIEKADSALYKAKEEGRNRICLA